MTPLAHELARCLGRMPGEFRAVAVPALTGAHFFEVTAALPLLSEIAAAAAKTRMAGDPFIPSTFLPAPNTWLEWQRPTGLRCAVSFCENDIPANMRLFLRESQKEYVSIELGLLNFQTGRLNATATDLTGEVSEEKLRELAYTACAALAAINSPRIVGRRAHPPHRLAARKLERAGINIGPLHDWHEIKLEVNKPRDVDDGEVHSNVITGKRCLHFVRKFIRIRLGRLEYVREHWRGDASVGVRRGRYVVTA